MVTKVKQNSMKMSRTLPDALVQVSHAVRGRKCKSYSQNSLSP